MNTGDAMNAYLDLSYIYSLAFVITTPYYFKRILNYKMSVIEIISICFFTIILYFNAFLFGDYKHINLLFLLIYFLVVYQKRFVKFYMIYVFSYYSSLSYGLIISQNIYLYKWVILVSNPGSFFLFLTAFINIFVIEIVMLTIKKIKLLSNYKIKAEIEIGNETYSVIGYMDSGNTLIKEDKPVIFLSTKYLKIDNTKEMIVTGMGVKKCKYVEAKINILNIRKDIICAFVDGISFKGCACLLNIYLMEGYCD